ncbi:50S ribosomal protein L4 [bacterium]|nr:50S ribosomal protein L4 [bacterium]
MVEMDIYNIRGETAGKAQLRDEIFKAPIRETLLHEAVLMYLANLRRGTVKTKTRSEVSGGGAKPWKQKGTGRARAGSNTSPLWRRGGTAFGPKPRDYSYSIPKKAKRLALCSALSSKMEEGSLVILNELKMERVKTKDMVNVLRSLRSQDKTLLILNGADEKIKKSFRNIPGCSLSSPVTLNTYDVLSHDKLLITVEALSQLEERLLKWTRG